MKLIINDIHDESKIVESLKDLVEKSLLEREGAIESLERRIDFIFDFVLHLMEKNIEASDNPKAEMRRLLSDFNLLDYGQEFEGFDVSEDEL